MKCFISHIKDAFFAKKDFIEKLINSNCGISGYESTWRTWPEIRQPD